MTINAQAQAAQDAARQQDGKFGTQARTAPDIDSARDRVLAARDARMAAMTDAARGDATLLGRLVRAKFPDAAVIECPNVDMSDWWNRVSPGELKDSAGEAIFDIGDDPAFYAAVDTHLANLTGGDNLALEYGVLGDGDSMTLNVDSLLAADPDVTAEEVARRWDAAGVADDEYSDAVRANITSTLRSVLPDAHAIEVGHEAEDGWACA